MWWRRSHQKGISTMDEKSYTVRVPKRWVRISMIVGVTALIVAPLTAIAMHSFDDVPNSHTFHDDIAWLKDADVTRGCNPPTNNLYCPDDNVTRGQMAAFMRRFAGTLGTDGAVVNDFNSNIAVNSATDIEVLSVDVVPRGEGEVEVVLNAHVTLEKPTSSEGRYSVTIRRDGCSGAIVGRGWWRGSSADASFEADTIPVTGVDTVSSDTTYKLCVAKNTGGDPNASASMRGLTAIWLPTS
jgi:hypothetical protein